MRQSREKAFEDQNLDQLEESELGEKVDLGNKEDEEEEDGVEPVDYTFSQDSAECFGTKMRKIQGVSLGVDVDDDNDGGPRRCDRLKSREYMRVEDLARERAAAKDNYFNASESEQKTSENVFLMHITSLLGIELGCSIDMVEHNLDIIKMGGS